MQHQLPTDHCKNASNAVIAADASGNGSGHGMADYHCLRIANPRRTTVASSIGPRLPNMVPSSLSNMNIA